MIKMLLLKMLRMQNEQKMQKKSIAIIYYKQKLSLFWQ